MRASKIQINMVLIKSVWTLCKFHTIAVCAVKFEKVHVYMQVMNAHS